MHDISKEIIPIMILVIAVFGIAMICIGIVLWFGNKFFKKNNGVLIWIAGGFTTIIAAAIEYYLTTYDFNNLSSSGSTEISPAILFIIVCPLLLRLLDNKRDNKEEK